MVIAKFRHKFASPMELQYTNNAKAISLRLVKCPSLFTRETTSVFFYALQIV